MQDQLLCPPSLVQVRRLLHQYFPRRAHNLSCPRVGERRPLAAERCEQVFLGAATPQTPLHSPLLSVGAGPASLSAASPAAQSGARCPSALACALRVLVVAKCEQSAATLINYCEARRE